MGFTKISQTASEDARLLLFKKKIRYVGISYIVEIKHVNAYIWLNDGQEERAFSFKWINGYY